MKNRVRRGRYKNHYRWEIWKNNKLVSWTLVKGSEIKTLTEALDRYKDKSTLNKDTKVYTNIKTTERLKSTNFKEGKYPEKTLRKPRAKRIQYQVSGYLDNIYIVGRSQILYSGLVSTVSEARDQAWDNFFMRVGDIGKNHYSSDKGKELLHKIKNLQEGWVIYYEVKKN